MRSDLRSLRERIRQVEAGGHRDTPLRRAYNSKIRAHRSLRGGGGSPSKKEMEVEVSEIREQVDSLSSKFDVLSSQVDTLRKDIVPVLLAQNMKTVEEENVATVQH